MATKTKIPKALREHKTSIAGSLKAKKYLAMLKRRTRNVNLFYDEYPGKDDLDAHSKEWEQKGMPREWIEIYEQKIPVTTGMIPFLTDEFLRGLSTVKVTIWYDTAGGSFALWVNDRLQDIGINELCAYATKSLSVVVLTSYHTGKDEPFIYMRVA